MENWVTRYRPYIRLVLIAVIALHVLYFVWDAKQEIFKIQQYQDYLLEMKYSESEENLAALQKYQPETSDKLTVSQNLSKSLWAVMWDVIVSVLLIILLMVIWVEQRIEKVADNIEEIYGK